MPNKGAITDSVGVGGTYSSTQNGYVTTINITGPTLSGNAGAGDVLSGKTFYSNSGTKQTGTMTNQGAVSQTINPGGSYTIPAGYHNGCGKVTANPNQNSGTYTPTSRSASLDMGANNTYRYVNTNSVPNTNSGTYTYAANSTGGTVDLGATNTYRYVNAANVYAKGKTDGANSSEKVATLRSSGFFSKNVSKTISFVKGDIIVFISHYLSTGESRYVPEDSTLLANFTAGKARCMVWRANATRSITKSMDNDEGVAYAIIKVN